MTSVKQPAGDPPSRRKLIVLLIAGGALFALFCGLGIWQLERLVWKLDLVDRVEKRIHAAPVGLDRLAGLSPANQEYMRVTIRGQFDYGKETLVKAVTEYGEGYWVITPFVTDGGRVVLVNRGFVPPDKRNSVSDTGARIAGHATITGLVRISEPGGAFLRTNDPRAGRWFSRDVAAIARARQLGRVEAYFIDVERTRGYPIGGLTVVQFRNTHFVYALTWFALALLTAWGIRLLLKDWTRRAIASDI